MILLIHTSTSPQDIRQELGRPEYSYRFVVHEFRALLDSLGIVIEVKHPEQEVDAIYASCLLHQQPCVFLCFMPPNKTPISLACPTIPVFAWEYDTLPNEAFGGKPRNDWTRVLAKLGAGLTHSSFTVERTRAAMGHDFPIASVPAPLWNRIQKLRHSPRASAPSIRLKSTDIVIDSRHTKLSAYRGTLLEAAAPATVPLPQNDHPDTLALDGILYTAILNPHDGRKNWRGMIGAFCHALRDKHDATLLLKLTHFDPSGLLQEMLECIYRAGPIACRVVMLHAYLEEDAYNDLLLATTYAVNTSHGEGQCLPLMEYMSAGKPAVAPCHTSMLDYVNADCAFVIDSSVEPGAWPHDQRQALHTLRQRIHYQSLVQAYRHSYYVAKHEPDVYASMAEAAIESLRRYCSLEVVEPRLRRAIEQRLANSETPCEQKENVEHA